MKENLIREILIEEKNSIRITRIENCWYETRGIRINFVMPNGHVMPGPEIPDEFIDETIEAINELRKIN